MFPMHMVVLLVIYFYSWLSRRIGLTYKDAAGLWAEDFWKPYVGTVVNLVCNIALVVTIGIEGVVVSTIVVMAFIYFPWETKVLFRNLFHHGMKEYVVKYYFYALVTGCAAVVTYFVTNKVLIGGISGLLIKGLICCVIPNILFLFAYFGTREFKDSVQRMKAMLQRKKG